MSLHHINLSLFHTPRPGHFYYGFCFYDLGLLIFYNRDSEYSGVWGIRCHHG